MLAVVGCSQQETAGGGGSGIEGVANAMGATNLNTIEYAGSGSVFGFGQAYLPGEAWPRFDQEVYRVQANYQAPAFRLDQTRSQGMHPPHGGAAQPIAGDQRTVAVVNGESAWAENGDMATPNPGGAAGDRRRMLWATPHGVIKAALANNGTLEGNTITFTAEGREFKATVSGDNLVEKVAYLNTNEVIGDYPVEVTYSDYMDYNGVKFPTHIVQTDDGHPTFDIRITSMQPNAAVTMDVPANVTNAAPPAPMTAKSEVLGPGFWYINAGGTWSWALDFGDHAVVVEAITSEARSLAVLEEVRRLMPNKPIRYLLNTHAHYDHAGGLRTFVQQGITIVTHEMNVPFYKEVWARPRTIAPDSLSKEPKEAVFETVSDKKVMTGGGKTLELYYMKNTGHNGANLLIYAPQQGVVFWGDGYNPPPGDDPIDPARTPEYGIDLIRVINENNLNVRTIAPAHGAGSRPYDNLRKAAGLMAP